MDGPDDYFLDDLFCQAAPMSDDEKVEILLGYFTALIETMDRTEVLMLRASIATMHVGTPAHETILEVVDGHLALREVR